MTVEECNALALFGNPSDARQGYMVAVREQREKLRHDGAERMTVRRRGGERDGCLSVMGGAW
jgi:hypothetical protein